MAEKRPIPFWMARSGCGLAVEIQAYCNLSCAPCPRNSEPTRARWRDGEPIRDKMSTAKVFDILNQTVDIGYKGPVHFSLYSEPLVDSRFVTFCKYAKKIGLQPVLYTNGVFLTDSLARQLDGVLSKVILGFASKGRIPPFKHTPVKVYSHYAVLMWSPHKKQLEKSIARTIHKPCVGPLYSGFRIQYNGQMMLCYADFNNSWGLLNAFNHSLEELWFGKEHVAAIRALSTQGSRLKFPLCKQCPEVFPNGGVNMRSKPRGQYHK